MSEASNTASSPKRHGGTVDVPLEALLAPDPELWLAWTPLIERGNEDVYGGLWCSVCLELDNDCACEIVDDSST